MTLSSLQMKLEEEHPVWLTAPAAPVASGFARYKRRASSLGDVFPQASPSAAKVFAKALHSVSAKTHAKFAKFRSQSDNFMKKSRAITNSSRFRWREEDALQHANATFEFHGEDAGANSRYFHIVADGVSSPFGRLSLVEYDGTPVSSAILAQEVARCVKVALEELTNRNKQPLSRETFEFAVVDAVKTARINCFMHRKSRLATTLAVSYFNRWTGRLFTFSLGDSKCLIVRNGAVAYETLAVLREFNVPTVVNLREQVAQKDYVVQTFALQKGDVCLTFSDGLGDNLYKDEIISTLKENPDLQTACDELVQMSKVHEQKSATEDNSGCLYPFATAATLEYRERTLEETKRGDAPLDASTVDHLAVSLELMERHKDKQTLDRHLLLRRPSRKHHYSLMQLKLIAEMQTKKPDDITLFMTRFV